MAATARQLGPGLALMYDELEKENRQLKDVNGRLVADNAALMGENLDLRRQLEQREAGDG